MATSLHSSSEEEKNHTDVSSFLEAAASVDSSLPAKQEDIENQIIANQQSRTITNPSVGILASHKGNDGNQNDAERKNEADDESRTSSNSVFSIESYEMKDIFTSTAASNSVPFPSVNAASQYASDAVNNVMADNVCPCRCLFFTLKESVCLALSALGCGVFLAGLVVLCLYLEGSTFEE